MFYVVTIEGTGQVRALPYSNYALAQTYADDAVLAGAMRVGIYDDDRRLVWKL